MYQAGTSKLELDVYVEGQGMLGYGRAFNKMEGKLTPLYVRTVFFTDVEKNERFIFVNCELAFVQDGIRIEVIKRLQERNHDVLRDQSELMITCQHTHSGPSGITHHPFYNFTAGGFRYKIYNIIVNTIVDSIIAAYEKLQPVQIKYGRGEFEPDIDIAFNRSLRAYNANKDVKKLHPRDTHLAVDRTMDLLRIDDLVGNPVAQINFFGVHTTSLGNTYNKMCSDNKGFASNFFEEEIGGDFIAIFAQKNAGDVSPNFHGLGRMKTKGPYKDDVENAIFNGRLQYYKAKEIYDHIKNEEPIEVIFDNEMTSKDFSKIKVDPDFANGKIDAETTHSCHGMAFFNGTSVDGPGEGPLVNAFGIFCASVIKTGELFLTLFKDKEYRQSVRNKYKHQFPKQIVFETGKGEALGTKKVGYLAVPSFIEKGIYEMRQQYIKGALREGPWTPHILPIQLSRLGNICFVGFPGEITTIGGKRLEKMIAEELKEIGIDHVIICTYANNYLGYCTTHEEYMTQCYEGGHTVYGQWTHGAFMTEFRKLAREYKKNNKQEREIDHEIKYDQFSDKEIELRMFVENE